MSNAETTVFVIDDDASVRRASERLIKSVGLRVVTFGSAMEFLNSPVETTLGASYWTSGCPG